MDIYNSQSITVMIFCVFQNDRELKYSLKYIYLYIFFYCVSIHLNCTRAPSINDVAQCPPPFDTLHSDSLKKKTALPVKCNSLVRHAVVEPGRCEGAGTTVSDPSFQPQSNFIHFTFVRPAIGHVSRAKTEKNKPFGNTKI